MVFCVYNGTNNKTIFWYNEVVHMMWIFFGDVHNSAYGTRVAVYVLRMFTCFDLYFVPDPFFGIAPKPSLVDMASTSSIVDSKQYTFDNAIFARFKTLLLLSHAQNNKYE